MAVRFRLTKRVPRPRAAAVATVADLAETAVVAEGVPAAVVVAAAEAGAVAEVVVAAEAAGAMAVETETAEIAGASNGNWPSVLGFSSFKSYRTISPGLRLGDEFDFHAHVARQASYLNSRTRGRRIGEIPAIDLIHRGKICHIREENCCFENLAER
jgi:hypothetical protein